MMTLTTEQIKQILEGAPEGATHYGDYAEEHHYLKEVSAYIQGRWEVDYDLFVDDTHDLSALREILTLRQRVDELEKILSSHERLASKGIYYTLPELVRHDAEVAARAVEGFADYFAVNYGEGEGFDRAIMHVKIKAREQAKQLRKGEGDE